MRKRVLFIDRDGTLIYEPADFQVDSFEKLRFLPGVITYLGKIAREFDYELVMVTNQDGLGTELFPEEKFFPVHNFLLQLLEGEGISFSKVFIDRSFPHENKATRKPHVGMLTEFFSDFYDLENSYVIGDRETDVELAKNLGSKAIFIANENFSCNEKEVFIAASWKEVYEYLKSSERVVRHYRKTRETEVLVEINMDGEGKANISTGIAFFDHLLEQVAKHGQIDLRIQAVGDLEVDEHHTIEDVAITLGEAFAIALKNKRGMNRYGFCLPMDDCLARVAVDFGGRSWLVWEADFRREMIGKMPTEMFFHFFKSFSDNAKCNLNIKAEGINEHHKIEAIFKAFARAVKMAVRRENSEILPSTKETL
ncbi:MAG: bifunctional histidinol-phosphatase/imidazoleglycerol-phosphate dehydratase HisB [Pyrinomonadaceae bacterium]|nr:bifunctional histidinol-phosphatase/imidazoleglycerol-phosphate dehydratase HisB [Pyrinomonadaceae bacterium]MCX7639488.1 bifunctional histidinol-phosphatase/imidazoleglycerol-phosphate dehydratase HisB [Pyrinomonadaceae bacterium]MDW8304461.1 bifunctional histidinol-phosphatase/imidazoleglycerol-phosphate dehydratase HisB [Acidobacteriota bacterium]